MGSEAAAESRRSGIPLGPIPVRTAAERVADRLVTAIALGQFAIGERLPPERSLAAMLDVSRTTVREAVALLAAAGYVSTRRGRAGGTFVESAWQSTAVSMIRRTLIPEWERLEHLLDFRSLIEAEIARVAAIRRTARDIEAIRAAVHAYLGAPPDRPSSSAADLHLHRTIAAATGNPYLVELSLRARRDVTLGMGADPWSPALRQRGISQHPELAHAVVEGDASRAAALASEHFSLTERTIRDLVESLGPGDRAGPAPGRSPVPQPTPLRGSHADDRG